MSLEKRGLILYEFCKHNYPEYQLEASIAWIEAGMSLKKLPAEKVKTKRQVPPENWQVLYGQYKENLRLLFPACQRGNQSRLLVWFRIGDTEAGTRIQSNELTEKINGRQDHKKSRFLHRGTGNKLL